MQTPLDVHYVVNFSATLWIWICYNNQDNIASWCNMAVSDLRPLMCQRTDIVKERLAILTKKVASGYPD